MKKLLLVVLSVFFLATVSFAQTPVSVGQVLTFEWEQATEDLGGLSGWVLYESMVSGSGYTKVLDIPYTSGSGPNFTSNETITFSGNKGTTVEKYFVLTAKSIDPTFGESEYSNEAMFSVTIPFGKPSSPFQLKVNIKTEK
jgi:hypothetical protein